MEVAVAVPADEAEALAQVEQLRSDVAATIAPNDAAPTTNEAPPMPGRAVDPYGLGVGAAATLISGGYLAWCLGQGSLTASAFATAQPIVTLDPLAAIESKNARRGRRLDTPASTPS